MPVSAFNSSSFFGLSFTHTFLQAVVDTRSISDNNRRSGRVSFANSFSSLSPVSTHSVRTIPHNISEAINRDLLAYTFTAAANLAIAPKVAWRLTTVFGTKLRIQQRIFTSLLRKRGQETTVRNRYHKSIITTDNPLKFLDDICSMKRSPYKFHTYRLQLLASV